MKMSSLRHGCRSTTYTQTHPLAIFLSSRKNLHNTAETVEAQHVSSWRKSIHKVAYLSRELQVCYAVNPTYSCVHTVVLDPEVGEPEAAGKHEHDADEQRAPGVVGHPPPQAVEEVVRLLVDPRVEPRPGRALLRSIHTYRE